MNRFKLTLQAAPLFGRQEEMAQLTARLTESDCRLLTIIGPGGSGKTHLALAGGKRMVDHFADGVFFVDLEPADPANWMAALIKALPFPPAGAARPADQLYNYLYDKEVLLVLDNFEHLLGEANQLGQLADRLPAVKFLVTSREALNLRQEWRFPLRGIAFPSGPVADDEDVEEYGAVRFFVARARRLQPDFNVKREKSGLVRICQLVEGLPLALEMAASWTKMMSCEAIAVEIEKSLTFLTNQRRDRPARHQSMTVVFAHSWRLLDPEEQAVFKRLAVFQGPFKYEAAHNVAGATRSVLRGLVDKTVVQAQRGTYRLHKLLRQFASVRLEKDPRLVAEVCSRHGAYYISFLAQHFRPLLGGGQRAAVAAIEDEFDNIRVAWQMSLQQPGGDHYRPAAQALSLFFQFQSRFGEGAEIFRATAASLTAAPPTLERERTLLVVLIDRAWFLIRLGLLEEAEEILEQCRDLFRTLDREHLTGHGTDPRLPLGIIALVYGDYDQAAAFGEAVLRESKQQEHLWNQQFSHYLLGRAALARGDNPAAEEAASRALAVTRQTGDRWFVAYCHNELGNVALDRRRYESAWRHYQSSYALRAEFEDPEGQALALNYLGKTAAAQHRLAEAEHFFRESQKIYRVIDDRGGLASVLTGLGRISCARGNVEAAEVYLRQALQFGLEIGYRTLLFAIFLALGELCLRVGRLEQGVTVVALAGYHPSSPQPNKKRARAVLAAIEPGVDPTLISRAVSAGKKDCPEQTAERLLSELSPAGGREKPRESDLEQDRFQIPQDETVEPLTHREGEVLGLLREGLTNREIAKELHIVVGTVKTHNHNIYRKLDVTNRTEAVVRAQDLGLLQRRQPISATVRADIPI